MFTNIFCKKEEYKKETKNLRKPIKENDKCELSVIIEISYKYEERKRNLWQRVFDIREYYDIKYWTVFYNSVDVDGSLLNYLDNLNLDKYDFSLYISNYALKLESFCIHDLSLPISSTLRFNCICKNRAEAMTARSILETDCNKAFSYLDLPQLIATK